MKSQPFVWNVVTSVLEPSSGVSVLRVNLGRQTQESTGEKGESGGKDKEDEGSAGDDDEGEDEEEVAGDHDEEENEDGSADEVCVFNCNV